jgi:hypothetical protein
MKDDMTTHHLPRTSEMTSLTSVGASCQHVLDRVKTTREVMNIKLSN